MHTPAPIAQKLRASEPSEYPAGRQIYQDLAPVALAFAQRLIAPVASPDRETFDRVLKALTDCSAKLAAEVAQDAGDLQDVPE